MEESKYLLGFPSISMKWGIKKNNMKDKKNKKNNKKKIKKNKKLRRLGGGQREKKKKKNLTSFRLQLSLTMTKHIKYIKFENHLQNMQKMLLYPLMEKSGCIIDHVSSDDSLIIFFDAKKLMNYVKKAQKMSSYDYTDILADQYARNILELSTDLAERC